MRSLKTILNEQKLNLDNTEKAIIASMAIAPTPEMAYSIVRGARNAVTARDSLEQSGYITVSYENKTAELTKQGQDVLTSENLTDETGELTERGEELVARYRIDKSEWENFE